MFNTTLHTSDIMTQKIICVKLFNTTLYTSDNIATWFAVLTIFCVFGGFVIIDFHFSSSNLYIHQNLHLWIFPWPPLPDINQQTVYLTKSPFYSLSFLLDSQFPPLGSKLQFSEVHSLHCNTIHQHCIRISYTLLQKNTSLSSDCILHYTTLQLCTYRGSVTELHCTALHYRYCFCYYYCTAATAVFTVNPPLGGDWGWMLLNTPQ